MTGLQRSINCSSSEERVMFSDRRLCRMDANFDRTGVILVGTTSTLCHRVCELEEGSRVVPRA